MFWVINLVINKIVVLPAKECIHSAASSVRTQLFYANRSQPKSMVTIQAELSSCNVSLCDEILVAGHIWLHDSFLPSLRTAGNYNAGIYFITLHVFVTVYILPIIIVLQNGKPTYIVVSCRDDIHICLDLLHTNQGNQSRREHLQQ